MIANCYGGSNVLHMLILHSKCSINVPTSTGGEGAWKSTKTSWVHCRLWLKVPATYPPITDWVHSKCSCRFQVEHMMWVYLWNILNVILTCAIHLNPHKCQQSFEIYPMTFLQCFLRILNISTTCSMGTFETYLECCSFFGCDQDVPQNEPM